jgi:hypothetical protein
MGAEVSEETEGQDTGAEAVAGGVDTPNTDPAQAPAPKVDAVKEEAPMEIHKPKPVHNWREFIVELGTITLGVCIALAAEQTVEWFHWRDKTNYATDQIQRELAVSMYYSMERIMVEGCIQHRLDDLEQKLLSSGEKWTPVAPAGTAGIQAGNVVAVPRRNWGTIAWTAAVADTSVTHFNRDRLTAYARIYASVGAAHEQNQREFENVAHLNILLKPVMLSNDKKVELIGVVEGERILNHELALDGSRLLAAWKQIGLDPAQGRARVVKVSTTYAACQAAPR